MKNLINEKPHTNLEGRLKFAASFVDSEDIKNKSVLDIGCGYGWFELNAVTRGVKQVTGIEISDYDLKAARENIKLSNVDFNLGGATKLPFANESFDTVVSWEVIEHIPKNTEHQMFAEVNRVLKKDGVFYLSTPFNSLASMLLDPAWWLIGHRHYSKTKLQFFGDKNCFTLLKSDVKGGYWTLFSLINLYVAKWLFRRDRFCKDLFTKKESREYQSSKGLANIFVKFKKNE